MDKQNRNYKNKAKSIHKAPPHSTPSKLLELPPITTEDTTPGGKQRSSMDKKK